MSPPQKCPPRGQVVIPEDIRKQIRLKAGSQFVVVGKDDVVILKSISPPVMESFDALIAAARKQAQKAKMKQSDIGAAIARYENCNESYPRRQCFHGSFLLVLPTVFSKDGGLAGFNLSFPMKSLRSTSE